jgi:very-short-patch-repair endonuclease
MEILSKIQKLFKPKEPEEVLYNLTELCQNSGRSKSAFQNWRSRHLDSYAKLNGYKIIIVRGGNHPGSQGTYTNSKECYDLAKKWVNKESMVTFKRAEHQFEQDVLRNLFGGYKILPQYQCCNKKYLIDWYIPELNLTIEFDEPGHDCKFEKDKTRQKEIEQELKCKFLRYTYTYNEK